VNGCSVCRHFCSRSVCCSSAGDRRDLDLDVEAVASAADEETRALAMKQLCADDDLRCEGTSLVHAVFRQALSRWFGVLFWFLLLGPLAP
jgi:AmpE protein